MADSAKSVADQIKEQGEIVRKLKADKSTPSEKVINF